ncbi:MAG: hypothetical protein JJ902_03975 [Roseibium sp.]|nr:hypothetical protein [Roseibium sp.]
MTTRRGFMGLLGGGAVAGPSAIKKALASAPLKQGSAFFNMPSESTPASYGLECNGLGARGIMNFMSSGPGVARQTNYAEFDADIAALKSISLGHKIRMQNQRDYDRRLSEKIQRFLEQKNLNWIGLSEDTILALIKQEAGE